MGKPVISTSKCAEGIDYTDGLNIIIENRIEKYSEIIQQLLDDGKNVLRLAGKYGILSKRNMTGNFTGNLLKKYIGRQ